MLIEVNNTRHVTIDKYQWVCKGFSKKVFRYRHVGVRKLIVHTNSFVNVECVHTFENISKYVSTSHELCSKMEFERYFQACRCEKEIMTSQYSTNTATKLRLLQTIIHYPSSFKM